MSTSIRENNQVNCGIEKDIKFDSNYSLSVPVKDPQIVQTFELRRGKKYITIYASGITCLWDRVDSDIIIKVNT